VDVVLALGSNLGDRLSTLQAGVDALAAEPGIEVVRASGVVETAPVGGPEQDDYLNAVLLVRCSLSPRDLLAACHRAEAGQGRERLVRWGPRTLDVDVVTYDALVSADPTLTLPHPRAHERAFVLVPWSQCDPGAVLPGPGGGPVSRLAAAADDADGVRVRADLSLTVPASTPEGGAGR
jgi:dihydroneopterin aldolase/2-amino-4-hydroxy-6-hydroxymethyldihydropteridine diphosphokinase